MSDILEGRIQTPQSTPPLDGKPARPTFGRLGTLLLLGLFMGILNGVVLLTGSGKLLTENTAFAYRFRPVHLTADDRRERNLEL